MKRKIDEPATNANKKIILHHIYSQQQIIDPNLINNLSNKNVEIENVYDMMDTVTNLDAINTISNNEIFQHLVSQQRQTNFIDINCKHLKIKFYDILKE